MKNNIKVTRFFETFNRYTAPGRRPYRVDVPQDLHEMLKNHKDINIDEHDRLRYKRCVIDPDWAEGQSITFWLDDIFSPVLSHQELLTDEEYVIKSIVA